MVGAQVPEATQRIRIQVSWLLAYPPLFVKTGSIFDMIREYTEYIHQFENALTRKLSIYLKPNLWFRQNRYSTNSHHSLVRIPRPPVHWISWSQLGPYHNIYLKPKTLEPYLLSSIFFHLNLFNILCTIFLLLLQFWMFFLNLENYLELCHPGVSFLNGNSAYLTGA